MRARKFYPLARFFLLSHNMLYKKIVYLYTQVLANIKHFKYNKPKQHDETKTIEVHAVSDIGTGM